MRGAAGLGESAHKHLLHIECRAGIEGLLVLYLGFKNNIVVAVENLGHEHGVVAFAIVSHGAIGVDEFEK